MTDTEEWSVEFNGLSFFYKYMFVNALIILIFKILLKISEWWHGSGFWYTIV